jgi:hypothetical protein
MRRHDREVTVQEEMEGIIGRAQVCRLALVDEGRPYVVPLSFGYRDGVLYFHSARQGRKVDILRRGGEVCFELDTPLGLMRDPEPCEWGMAFESVIGWGFPRFVDDPAEKVQALECIMVQYGGGGHPFDPVMVARTAVFAVDVVTMTAKRCP